MTVTLNPQDVDQRAEVDNRSEIVDAAETKTDVHELAALLAQAYVAAPLFP
jgi:hypothetical protein